MIRKPKALHGPIWPLCLIMNEKQQMSMIIATLHAKCYADALRTKQSSEMVEM